MGAPAGDGWSFSGRASGLCHITEGGRLDGAARPGNAAQQCEEEARRHGGMKSSV